MYIFFTVVHPRSVGLLTKNTGSLFHANDCNELFDIVEVSVVQDRLNNSLVVEPVVVVG